MTECTVEHTIDYDSLNCHLIDGHAGPHKCVAEEGNVWWQKELTRKRDE